MFRLHPPPNGSVSHYHPPTFFSLSPGWGSLRWDSKVYFRVLSESDYWVITLQIADPSSRQRGRPIDVRPQISDNIPTGNNIWSQVPQGYSIPRHTDWLTDWLTVSRKVTSTSKVFDYFVVQPTLNLCSSPDIIRIIKIWSMKRSGNVVCAEKGKA
jgi:hypothetical protein